MDKCDKCGAVLEIGSWPYCPDHGRPTKSKGFEAFFDDALQQTITGMGDVNKACRPYWENDNIVHIQPRDKGDSYYRELNERREARREESRRR